jgi:hypothetical protein
MAPIPATTLDARRNPTRAEHSYSSEVSSISFAPSSTSASDSEEDEDIRYQRQLDRVNSSADEADWEEDEGFDHIAAEEVHRPCPAGHILLPTHLYADKTRRRLAYQ